MSPKATMYFFFQEDTCLEANLTLDEVNTCAKNETALNERSRAKMCNNYPKCQGEQLFYHCVRINNYTLVEVCAPMHKIIGKQNPNVKLTNYFSISNIDTLKSKCKMYFNFKYINIF